MNPHPSISTLPTGNPLHILRKSTGTVDGLAALDSIRHLAHVHVDLATVLGEAVEAIDGAGVCEEETGGYADAAGKAHRAGEGLFAGVGGGDLLH